MTEHPAAVHTILYFGNFDLNFRCLRPTTATYVNKDEVTKDAELATDKVTGLKFRYMQRSAQEFLAVAVEDIVLRAPILLIPERHTESKGFAHAPYFSDEFAAQLLVDMIVANPEYRDALGRLLRGLGR